MIMPFVRSVVVVATMLTIFTRLAAANSLRFRRWASRATKKLCVAPESTNVRTETPFNLQSTNSSCHNPVWALLICRALSDGRVLLLGTFSMSRRVYTWVKIELSRAQAIHLSAQSGQLVLYYGPLHMWQLVHLGPSSWGVATTCLRLALSPLLLLGPLLLHTLSLVLLLVDFSPLASIGFIDQPTSPSTMIKVDRRSCIFYRHSSFWSHDYRPSVK